MTVRELIKALQDLKADDCEVTIKGIGDGFDRDIDIEVESRCVRETPPPKMYERKVWL